MSNNLEWFEKFLNTHPKTRQALYDMLVYEEQTNARIAALEADNTKLRAALLNLVLQFAEDGQEPSSEDLEFMEAIRQARTALTTTCHAEKGG